MAKVVCTPGFHILASLYPGLHALMHYLMLSLILPQDEEIQVLTLQQSPRKQDMAIKSPNSEPDCRSEP